MRLFVPATDRRLGCDAVLIDSERRVRPFRLELLTPVEPVVDALVERAVLMGRSMYDVAQQTFALLCSAEAGSLMVAVTEPYHEGILATVRDTLSGFGTVSAEPERDLREGDFWPLLCSETGRVRFVDSPQTHGWLPLAGRRGLPIVAATLSHAPDPDIFVGDVPAAEYVDDITLEDSA